MATLPNVQSAPTDLTSILGMLGNGNMMDSLFGQNTTKSGTSTSTTKIDQAGLNSMLADLLGSTQGLSAILGGQRGAGMYNSSVNNLLASDFITRMAGQVAQRNSTTTGATTDKIARKPQVRPEQAFLASLLKNLGKTQLQAKLPTSQDKRLQRTEMPTDQTISESQTGSLPALEQSMGYETGSLDPTATGGDNYGYDTGAGMEYAGLDYNWGWEGAQVADPWLTDNGFTGSDYAYIDTDPVGGLSDFSGSSVGGGDFYSDPFSSFSVFDTSSFSSPSVSSGGGGADFGIQDFGGWGGGSNDYFGWF